MADRRDPDDRELMRIHVATLFTMDGAGRLLRVNEPEGGEAPRFFVGRTQDGSECWFRHDVDDALVRELRTALHADPFSAAASPLEPRGPAPFDALLAHAAPVERTWAGPAYIVPDGTGGRADAIAVTEPNAGILLRHLEAWMDSISSRIPTRAVVIDRRAVAICSSVRISPMAHEAGVETAPGFRGRGFAARAVAAWATDVRGAGAIPLYSTSWDNTASQAVAKKLGLRMFGIDLHIT